MNILFFILFFIKRPVQWYVFCYIIFLYQFEKNQVHALFFPQCVAEVLDHDSVLYRQILILSQILYLKNQTLRCQKSVIGISLIKNQLNETKQTNKKNCESPLISWHWSTWWAHPYDTAFWPLLLQPLLQDFQSQSSIWISINCRLKANGDTPWTTPIFPLEHSTDLWNVMLRETRDTRLEPPRLQHVWSHPRTLCLTK